MPDVRFRRGNRGLILKGTSLVIRRRLCGILVVSYLIYFRHFDRSKSPVDSAPFTKDYFQTWRSSAWIHCSHLCLATLSKRREVLLRSTVLSLCLAKVSKGGEVYLGQLFSIFVFPHFPKVEKFCLGQLFSVLALQKHPDVEKF